MYTKTEKMFQKNCGHFCQQHSPNLSPAVVTCKPIGRSSGSLSWALGEGKKTFLPGQWTPICFALCSETCSFVHSDHLITSPGSQT